MKIMLPGSSVQACATKACIKSANVIACFIVSNRFMTFLSVHTHWVIW